MSIKLVDRRGVLEKSSPTGPERTQYNHEGRSVPGQSTLTRFRRKRWEPVTRSLPPLDVIEWHRGDIPAIILSLDLIAVIALVIWGIAAFLLAVG